MALSVTTTPGTEVSETGELVTPAILNMIANPTFTITGTIQTSDIAAGAITAVKATPGAYFYIASTVATNAYSGTHSPAPASLVDGLELTFKAAGSNTGAATYNPNSLGAKSIRKRYNLTLTPNDIRSGQMVTVRYDQTNDWFQMVTPSGNLAAPGINGTSKGLVIQNTNGSEATSLDITADAILLQDTNGNIILVETLSTAAVITAGNVLGGLDTGAEAASTWYYIWALSTGAAHSCVLSTSSSSPDSTFLSNNPTYVFKALIGVVRNDGSSNFLDMYQVGNRVSQEAVDIFAANKASNGGAFAALSGADLTRFESAVPPIAKGARGRWGSKNASFKETYVDIAPDNLTNPTGIVTLTIPGTAVATTGGFYSCGTWEVSLKTRNIYWRSEGSDARNFGDVNGYTL